MVLEAVAWGAAAASALVAGAAVAWVLPVPVRVVAWVMALGAGALISSVAFELSEEAVRGSGAAVFAVGLAAGSLTYFGVDLLLARAGARDRKRSHGRGSDQNAGAITAGAVLDGIPESVVIGTAVAAGTGGIGASFVAAVFLSNVPEGMSAAAGMQRGGRSARFVFGLWLLVVAISAAAAGVGALAADHLGPDALSLLQSFAAGTILVMLADTMVPEAYEEGGAAAGLFTALGFAASALATLL